MAVVKINAIEVPEGKGEELERRFEQRHGSMKGTPGFLGFELLRPVNGEDRYYVYTRWETEEDFQAWASGPAKEAHSQENQQPVATGATLMGFEVVLESHPGEQD